LNNNHPGNGHFCMMEKKYRMGWYQNYWIEIGELCAWSPYV